MPTNTPPINPYGAPQAPVGDYVAGDRAVLDTARSVSPDHGLAWYREGWRLFKVSPGVWIGIWIVFVVALMVLGFVPIIGSLAAAIVTPVFAGGAMIAARNADTSGSVRFGDLFAAFSGRATGLMIIGLIQLLLSAIVFFVFALFLGFSTMFGAFFGSMGTEGMSTDVLKGFAIVGIVSVLVFAPITNAVWLASALVALEGAPALDAMRRGFVATFRNILPLIVLVLLTFVLAIAATIPFGLGWFVLGPLLLCVMYAQFKDLFDASGGSA